MSPGASFPSQSSQQQKCQAFSCKSKLKGPIPLPKRKQVLHLHFLQACLRHSRSLSPSKMKLLQKITITEAISLVLFSLLLQCFSSPQALLVSTQDLLQVHPGRAFISAISRVSIFPSGRHEGRKTFGVRGFFVRFVFNGAHRPRMRSAPKVMPPVSLRWLLQKWAFAECLRRPNSGCEHGKWWTAWAIFSWQRCCHRSAKECVMSIAVDDYECGVQAPVHMHI